MDSLHSDCDVSITFELSGVSEGAIVTVDPPHCMPSATKGQISAEIIRQLEKKHPPRKCKPTGDCTPTGETTFHEFHFDYEPFTLTQNGSDGTCVSHVHGSCEVKQTTVLGHCGIDA